MPNATVRANARTTPKPPPPGSAKSTRRQTADLEAATALLNAAKVVERASPLEFPPAERERRALRDLETPISQLHDLTTIMIEWADSQNFYHPNAAADDDTNREHSRQLDRLMFGLDQIAERTSDLREAFRAAVITGRPA